jgi:hypothetical protein
MSGMRDSPSSRLYSLWACRWTNCGAMAPSSFNASQRIDRVFAIDLCSAPVLGLVFARPALRLFSAEEAPRLT